MKVCDRHPDTRSTDTIHFIMDESRIDVCAKCKTDVLELLSLPPFEDEPSQEGRKPLKKLLKKLRDEF